ncbi:MAG: hypothetical protein ACLSUW_02530 [Akkermansia sp.]
MGGHARFDRVFGSIMVLPHGKTFRFRYGRPQQEITVTFGNTALKTKTDSREMGVTLPPCLPAPQARRWRPCKTEDSANWKMCSWEKCGWLPANQHAVRLNQTTTAKEDIGFRRRPAPSAQQRSASPHQQHAPYSAKDFDAVTTDNFYKGQWAASSPATSGPMTAVGYYFGKNSAKGWAFR